MRIPKVVLNHLTTKAKEENTYSNDCIETCTIKNFILKPMQNCTKIREAIQKGSMKIRLMA